MGGSDQNHPQEEMQTGKIIVWGDLTKPEKYDFHPIHEKFKEKAKLL